MSDDLRRLAEAATPGPWEWQPIETHRQSTLTLALVAYECGHVTAAEWVECGHPGSPDFFKEWQPWIGPENGDYEAWPTHWMPLPAPPVKP